MQQAMDAVKRLQAIVEKAWNEPEAEYVPPPGLHPGLGVAQIVPRYIREDLFIPALIDAGELLYRFISSQISNYRTRQAQKRALVAPGIPATDTELLENGDSSPNGLPGNRRNLAVGTLKQLVRLLPPTEADPETARAIRLAQERRKICRRSTISPCPTPEEVRNAYRVAGESRENRLRLGRMLMDLECYVDNDLVVRWYRKRPKIVARHPGIRGWLATHCPELSSKYKTLMRYKSQATQARQESGRIDPVHFDATVATPLSTATPTATSPVAAISSTSNGRHSTKQTDRVRVQPRRPNTTLPRRYRFAWERGSLRIDANGRLFLTNENYTRAIRSRAGMHRLLAG